MNRQRVGVSFENNVCRDDCPFAGRYLNELIEFDKSKEGTDAFYLTHIPRVGETIALPVKDEGVRLLFFEVLAVQCIVTRSFNSSFPQTLMLFLRQFAPNRLDKNSFFRVDSK